MIYIFYNVVYIILNKIGYIIRHKIYILIICGLIHMCIY